MTVFFAGASQAGEYWLLAILVITLSMMVFLRKLDERAERKKAQEELTGTIDLPPDEAAPNLTVPDRTPSIQTEDQE